MYGREPIFSETHTNEFFGIRTLAQKPAGPCAPLRPGRWVCEKGRAKRSQVLWGGCPGRPGHLSTAAFAGRFSPISSFAALAWCPTVCRGTDVCGEHHPSTVAGQAFDRRAGAASGKTSFRRKGAPRVRRGVGYVGAWRFARPLKSHRGYLPVGDAARLSLPVGPPLGAPRRCLRGAHRPPLSPADGALGNSGGESRCDPRRDRRTPDEQRGHAGLAPADPVT